MWIYMLYEVAAEQGMKEAQFNIAQIWRFLPRKFSFCYYFCSNTKMSITPSSTKKKNSMTPGKFEHPSNRRLYDFVNRLNDTHVSSRNPVPLFFSFLTSEHIFFFQFYYYIFLFK